MKNSFTLGFLLLLVTSFSVAAQDLAGKIVSEIGQPVSNAYIFNSSSNIHVHSDENGVFILPNVNVGDSIKITHLGYENYSFRVSANTSSINITLHETSLTIGEITIEPRINATQLFTEVDLNVKPVNNSQEILPLVPGLFIGQHAGGGKAEQIFIRGFDVDHGTDLNITVDGMPVNMVSHAHGQGYADLHFLIPELTENIEFDKGPYTAAKGNFATAGYVNFKTKRSLEKSLVRLEFGQFNTQRMLLALRLANNLNHQSYIAIEGFSSDGAFESPMNLKRLNLTGSYSGQISKDDQIRIVASYFSSAWDASGQIPQRAVDQGLITRWGSIDDTEGGYTSRANLNLEHLHKVNNNTTITSSLYYSYYDFELYSNFTFWLEDSVNGDQIKQKETRNLVGLNTELNHLFETGSFKGDFQVGIDLRADVVKDNELSHTKKRYEFLGYYQLGNVNETQLGTYVNANFRFNRWTINPVLRLDVFQFSYQDLLQTEYTKLTSNQYTINPKFNILYNPNSRLQLYVKTGSGFHTNDARAMSTFTTRTAIPRALGYDLGFIWKPTSRLLINTAYWYLYSQDELVYVGDAGIVESVGPTKRIGVDLSLRYEAVKGLFLNIDANWAKPRIVDAEEGENYVPLAPAFTTIVGLNYKSKSRFSGGLNFRHMSDRPANEDYSITAFGYNVIDFNINARFGAVAFGIQIANLLNTEWNETQFATLSRLQHESQPVEEIHFTPGTPFFTKLSIQYSF